MAVPGIMKENEIYIICMYAKLMKPPKFQFICKVYDGMKVQEEFILRMITLKEN